MILHNHFLIFILCFVAIDGTPLRAGSYDLNENLINENVKFYLYTQSNPDDAQQLINGDVQSIKTSNFNNNRHTKFIIHGWGGSYLTSPNGAVRSAYLSKDNYNIISVDWYEYAKLNYISSRAKVPVVGEEIATFIDFLNEKFDLNFDNLVVIGHSLGAHVAGFTGKNVKNGILAGIVGLDPAYPLYSYENPETRLADTDAKYVETIQTNGNTKGFLKPIGNVAFYPNWGRSQPGCGLDLDGTCAHARSVTYYAESIRGYSFAPIYECSSFDDISNKSGCTALRTQVQIGDPLQIPHNDGIFYFVTNSGAPFGHIIERS